MLKNNEEPEIKPANCKKSGFSGSILVYSLT